MTEDLKKTADRLASDVFELILSAKLDVDSDGKLFLTVESPDLWELLPRLSANANRLQNTLFLEKP